MDIVVRSEHFGDHAAITDVVTAAFADIVYSDHREHHLVARLRTSDAFVPDLSLVALVAKEIVGHVMFTKVSIAGEMGSHESLALAPLSVAPAFQRQGVGTALIAEGHRRAAHLGLAAIVVLGDAGYYRRFGYDTAARHGVAFPFAVKNENCMIRALTERGLAGLAGRVVYPPAFAPG